MKREDSSKLGEPLMHDSSSVSEDPFYGFREELKVRIDAAASRFENWKRLLNETNTAESLAFKDENGKLKGEVTQLLTNVHELEEVLYRIETNRQGFSHISDDELSSRKISVKELKQRVNIMKYALSSQRTLNKIKSDAGALQAKRRASLEQEHLAIQDNSTDEFIRSQQQRQHMLREEQDEHLDGLHESAVRLNDMAGVIGDEIEDQGRMLDELADDLDQTESRMEHALTRMDKLLKSNNRCQTWTILMLIAIATVMFFLVVNSF